MPKRHTCFVHSSTLITVIDSVVLNPIMDWREIADDQERLCLRRLRSA
jgi:hypothetical protein